MHLRHAALVASLLLTAAPALVAQAPSPGSTYLTPPKSVVDILDAAPTPGVILSPDRKTLALTHRRSMITIAELSQPIERLAGYRINPRTNGAQQVSGATFAITLKAIADGVERKVAVPPNAILSAVSFSPDGRRLAFVNTTETAMELWIADTATGQARALTTGGRLNGTSGFPCSWLEDSGTMLCSFVPVGRGTPPAPNRVPTGPNIQENYGVAAPQPTIQDLLKTEHDEALLEYYFTSQLAFVDVASGRLTTVGKPGIIFSHAVSPNDEYLLVASVKRPYSRLVALFGFPMAYEVWNRKGEVVRRIFDRPSTEGVPINGVPKGPRSITWRRDHPATLVWSEALDEGDLRNKVSHRDKVMTLPAPFTATPAEIARTQWRYGGLSVTEKGVMLLSESDRETRRVRTSILEGNAPPRTLWERRQQDAYGDPGFPLMVRRTGGARPGPAGVILQNGDDIYLSGQGASPDGDRPFLDRLNLKTLKTDRLFRAEAKTLESIVAPLDNDMRTLLTLYQTPADPPNYFVRDVAAGTKKAVTSFKDPAPQFAGVEQQFLTYKRKDGIDLTATLYLPPGYKKGERLPVVMWAYPTEFTDPADASQVVGSPYRFTRPSGSSHLFLLLHGYAIVDDPKMPIVGPGETANDTYVDQLVASAQAAIDKVVDMGVGDRDRVGVGGHSYGAFMTANLLAHSDLFRAGIARSGAYNRTLTPFGFQAERRTFWEVPDIYGRMSPFFHANRINEPILLLHGEMDNNSGTFPIQSERLYMALKGHGASVRYVTLPYESHGYAARESVLHTLAEMINWLDKYVKSPQPKTTTAAGVK
jgi:dipeptidyl aminopeptidase/acylaminoacyl peptidase